jgi:Protein of unknown function (DUF3224)
MKNKYRAGAVLLPCFILGLAFSSIAHTQTKRPAKKTQKEKLVTKHASGTFDVKVLPQADEQQDGPTVGRMTLDKQFHGDLDGTSKGQMLAYSTEVKGSAGYVAMERVNGSLNGKSGSFALQHSGTMDRGKPQLIITVVPDSGTGDLAGLSGKMTINIVDGKHFYEFDYTLAK